MVHQPRPMRSSTLLIVVTAAAVGLAPVVTQAAPSEDGADSPGDAFEQAEALRQEALEAYNAGDLETTLDKFKAAYEIDPSPAFLFNIGRVYEEMGELELALEYYEKFARQPRLRLEEREQAAERIEVLRKLVGPGDGDPPPSDDPPPVEDDEPKATPNGEDEPPVGESRPLIIAGASLLGVGAALALGGGLGLGFAARDRSDRVDEITPGNNPEGLTLSEVEDLDAQGRTLEFWQIATAAAGGAIAVTGGVLLGVGLSRRSKAKATARVQPVLGCGLAGVSIHTRF